MDLVSLIAAFASRLAAEFKSIRTALAGKISGPASVADSALVLFDGTTGKLVKTGGAPAVFLGGVAASATAKTTLADTDAVTVTSGFSLFKITWANIKAMLSPLYATAAQGGKADTALQQADKTELNNAIALKAPLAGPVFTDIPRGPTPAAGTNTDQFATTAFVQALVNGLIGGAPGLLDTFDEIAAAVGDDPNFATTILNSLAGKQPLDSDLTAIATLTTQTFGRSVLTAADAAALRTMAELVVGTHVQAYDADLAAIAALSTTPFGRGLLTIADQAGLLASAGALAVSAQASVAQIIAGSADDVYMTPADFAAALQAITFVPSAINLAALINGKVTLSGNVIFAAPTNAKEQTGYFYITQDSAGGRTASWNTFWDFGTDGPPTLSTGANKTDLVTYTVLPGATKALCSFKAAA